MRTLLSMALACTLGTIIALTLAHLGHLSGGLIIAGAAAIVAASEAISFARRRRRLNRGKTPIYPQYELSQGSWELPADPFDPADWAGVIDADAWRPHCQRAVWPIQAGAPE